MATSSCKYEKLEEGETDTSLKTSRDSKTKLKIALVGETGSGKSSFINAILGLEDGEDGAAGTGFEKTIVGKAYPHPLNPNVILWDLPGLDTLKHSDLKTYFKTFYLEGFDAFLLFINGNYTKTDQNLAKELDSKNKPFFLVRTKIDSDMPRGKKNNENQILRKSRENEILRKIRENVLEILKDLNDGDATDGEKKIFLISNFDPERWDFDRLKKAILYECQPSPATTSPSETAAQETNEQMKNIDREVVLRDLRKKMEDVEYEFKECSELDAVQKKMEKVLGAWKETEIKLAVVGNAGVGKSSFINALRGLNIGHPEEAKTGPIETTMFPASYSYPDNPLITLWDLPGVGTINYPDLKTYYKKIDLGSFDEFVIISATRFSFNDMQVAKRLKSMNKPFFFVRTKIDQDCENEKKKPSFDEERMLDEIKGHCADNLKGLLLGGDDDIFLISNHVPYKWDFPRLVEAILNKLPFDKQVCFIFSLSIVSKSILREKVKRLRGRIWRVALKSLVRKIGRSRRSRTYNFQVIQGKVEFYLHQLGIPMKDSEEFKEMSTDLQEEVQKFYLTSEISVESYLKKFDPDGAKGETDFFSWLQGKDIGKAKIFPWLHDSENSCKVFGFVHYSLNCVLTEMSKVSLKILSEKRNKLLPK